jgi:hypothetical protein
MLATHRQIWDGRLCRVSATSHYIDLVPGARPVHFQPYRAVPRAREAESAEVRRMLDAGVIEPASFEWASPVVLVPVVVYRYHCSSNLECRIYNMFRWIGLEVALTPLGHVECQLVTHP